MFGMLFLGFFFLRQPYAHIRWLIVIVLIIKIILINIQPVVSGHRKKRQKVNYLKIFQNPAMVCLIFFNLMFQWGSNIFHNYYPIYFEKTIGANSVQLGIMLFGTCILEIPILLIINRFVKKWGYHRVMIIAGIAACIRWTLLSYLVNINAIIGINILHGLGYAPLMYCLVLFINYNVEKPLRATAQMTSAVVTMVVVQVCFGYLNGVLCDIYGVNNILRLMGVVMAFATVAFAFWYSLLQKKGLVVRMGDGDEV
jgi:PPP family 3-phenylpropionic acid transporter